MARFSKIRSIYFKELLETMRDKRTLLAMFVVPALLYPLMMLGVAKIQLREQTALETAEYTVAVPSREHALLVREMLAAKRESDLRDALEAAREDPGAGVLLPRLTTFPEFDVMIADPGHEEIGETCDVKLVLDRVPTAGGGGIADLAGQRLEGTIIYRKTYVHSDAAARYLRELFKWRTEYLVGRSMTIVEESLQGSYPGIALHAVLRPIDIREEEISSSEELGGWVLSQIIPLVLVLMTISGAVYPAIDLTAGERERGTLETLMVAPVHNSEVITGKFLVVTTIAIATAVLNVVSMGATFQFGGLSAAIAGQTGSALPLHVLPIILLCLFPFAVLSSALLLAVCSFARTFKEAQNYVMPVLVLSMLPAAVGLMPTMQLEGAMLVAPVANLTLLTRDLFQQTWTWSAVVVVTFSTGLYALAAVAVATKLFGQETVIFADSLRAKTLLFRRWIRAQPLPAPAQVLVPVALLFPIVFHLQSALQRAAGDDLVRFMRQWGAAQVLLFVGVPFAVAWYLKVDLRRTFSLHRPRMVHWLGAILLGASAWVIASEFALLQTRIFGQPAQLRGLETTMLGLMKQLGPAQALLLFAVLPGLCEEFLFRGFLQGGMRRSIGKWRTIVIVGVVFGVFHLYGFKIATTALLGMLLAYVCWQSGSIWPGVLAHALHNSVAVLLVLVPDVGEWLRLDLAESNTHLPLHVLVLGGLTFIAGILLMSRVAQRKYRQARAPLMK